MAHPSLKIEVGFTAGAYDPLSSVTWTDISAYGRGFKTKRGRQHFLARTEPGTASILLNNRDRRFDPTNTSSPYAPNVLPNRRIRISAVYAAVTYRLFTGYVENWALQDPDVATSDVMVGCVDALKLFNMVDLASSPWQVAVRKDKPKAWLRLGESGTVAADSSGNNLNGQYQGGTQGVQGLIDGDADKAFTPTTDSRVSLPYKTLLTGYPFTFECWMRADPDPGPEGRALVATTPGPGSFPTEHVILEIAPSTIFVRGGQLFANVDSGGGNNYSYSGIRVDDGRVHHVVWVMLNSSTPKLYVDGVEVTDGATGSARFPPDLGIGWAVGNAPAMSFGTLDFALRNGVIDEAVFYDYALSPARVAYHHDTAQSWINDRLFQRVSKVLDAVDWPTADRDIDAGQVDLAAGTPGTSVLGHLQVLAETEGGIIYIDGAGKVAARDRLYALTNPSSATSGVVIGNTGGINEIPHVGTMDLALDDVDLWNRAQVSAINGTMQQADDSVSQDAYGKRTLSRSGQLYKFDADSADAAHYLVDKYSDPLPRVRRLTFTPASLVNTLIGPLEAWPVAFIPELLDRVTAKHLPVGGGSAFSQDALIESIDHEWFPPAPWRTTWSLEPADTRSYWVLGSSALDSGTRLFY